MSPRLFLTLAVLAFFQFEARAQAVDSDGDGLSDFIESFIGTNPTLFDTDSDGLGDGYELSSSDTNPLLSDTDSDGLLDGLEVFVYFTDPRDNDSDNDDLADGNEIKVHATNPKDSDTDDDGMPDGWEVINSLAPKSAGDAALDADADGLTNLREYQLGTNPRSADTDADGMPDAWESQNGLALLANDAALDADSDGLTNLREYQLGTNPKDADSDNDGIADGAEVDSYATSPNATDTDNDGLTDYQELFVFGTNAIVANPMPAIPVFNQVGDPQNPDDDGGQPDVQNSGRGYVGQEFTISTTEVTNWMYALFLNSVAKRDRLYDLYKADMGDSAQGGIVRRGSGGSYTYEVKAGFEDKPVNFVSLGDVLRYINWLHNWKVRDDLMRDAFRPTLTGSQDQDASTTEDGVYALRGKNPVNFTRHPDAKFFLPDVDEWHKAAYYDPAPGGSRPSESYWDWATQKMNLPTREGLAASNSPNDLHPVGTATGNFFGPSHYGTFDQDGNVAEWTQDALILGGRATSTADSSSETAYLGFRVASPVANASGVQETIPLAVEIGEPGNLNDEEFARTFNSLPAIGAVNYAYKMGAYEVTNRDYARFLNAKAKEDSFYRLYDVRMESDAVNGGITRSGENGSYVYSVKRGMARKPVVFVSIFSAMRYCNWLHNGGRTDSDTEAGAYRLLGNIPTNTSQLTRNSTARYFLPNAGEFYKAAYYDSSAGANTTFDYWKFATRSDSFDSTHNNPALADVDFSSVGSYFGTYGQSGNVGYTNPGSGANTPAQTPTAGNSGELLEASANSDDESADRTFRIAGAKGAASLRPLGDEDTDGLFNGWEALNDLSPYDATGDNGAAGDPDNDGLTNTEENAAKTDPKDSDTDLDGLTDFAELRNHLTDPKDSDTDNDGLSDGAEVNTYAIDPKDTDTDNDGLSDGAEVNTHTTDPKDSDTDNDGLSDGAEVNTHNTNPRLADTDVDGTPDKWEIDNSFNPANANDAALDADSDGLTNLQEFTAGSDPKKADTDVDGMPDKWEVDNSFNPANANDAALDADSDGLTNLQEFTAGTRPRNADTDGDGMRDGWEVQYALNPLVNDAGLDVEPDDLTNLREFQLGTLPRNSDTDADLLTDGDEVNVRTTNPLKPDTDGDGMTDYQELFVFGSNPLTTTPIPDAPLFREVGNPRNPDDDGGLDDIQNAGRGYVGQEFEIAITEVTNLMYAKFLNAVARSDRFYGLYKEDMGTSSEGGILRSGGDGTYSYSVKPGYETKPVNFVSLWDALRYINWLHNGMPATQVQDATTTEDGVYALRGTNPTNFTRHPAAKFYLPDVDEWHKAAYYDPNPGPGLPAPLYWDRATQALGTKLASSTLPLLPVGTRGGDYFGPSHYGTYDQDGNVEEWTQNAVILGGGVTSTDNRERASLGFRVAKPVDDTLGAQVTVPLMVEVGEPGNLADEQFSPALGDVKLGAVNYAFQMGAYEVSNREYVDFLNAKAKADSFYRLFDTRMETDPAGGIRRTGAEGTYSYSIKPGFANKPVVFVSIYSAMRYCNWLHNGGAAGSDMEDGAYRLLGNIPTNTSQLTRNSGARYYLPNANEFYKAAYYDSSTAANVTFDYWKFATRSDSYSPALNSSVPADVNSTSDSDNNNLYDAGAASFFGTYGQSGNVGYVNPGSGANTPAPKPTAANTGELLEEATNNDDESATRTFRIAAAVGVKSLPPLGDADSDGLPNAWEVLNGLDVNTNDASLDPDNDGVTNIREYQLGTNPRLADTDGDTLKDGDEVDTHHTGPLNPDTDGDGLSDGVEITGGTNPLVFTQGTVPLMVEIGEPGNLDDEEFGREFYDEAIGKVSYAFQMGAYEVTNRDYVRFLNTKAKEDAYFRLFDARMETDTTNGGIIRTGENGNYSYAIRPGFAKKPVVYVSVFSAMRYCNWMHNGGRPDSGMESGAYALMGSNPANGASLEPPRSASARFFLPKAGEFYKSAYFDSSAAANTTFDYWKFATRSDSFNPVLNGSALSDVSSTSDSDDNNFYDAGAASFFGTYGQSGNVGYAAQSSGKNTPASAPTTSNTGELIDDRRPSENDDEITSPSSGLWAFRIAAAAGVQTLRPLADEDGDGLPNAWEELHGLDPFDNGVDNLRTPTPNDGNPSNGANGDPDGESLFNSEEYASGADPLLSDTDGDGLDDRVEVKVHGTDPAKPDTDSDGMPDKWEVDNGFNPLSSADAGQDADGDGLTNLREFQLGTKPRDPDSDGDGLNDGTEVDTHRTDPLDSDTDNDGMPDGWEVQYTLNPLVNDASQDADGDGLTNLREYQLGTNPRDTDSDDDGLTDGAEVDTHRTDPLDSDTDNDGMSDYWEIYYGRNPTSGTDRDTDNDGATDGAETAAGTDPLTFNTPVAAPSLVTIGAPGNTGAGAVAQSYRIGAYEVTNEDYARFLNAVARISDGNSLYDTRMAFSAQDDPNDPWSLNASGGILRTGTAGSYVYAVKPNFARKPVNFVSYDSALRYCNWLHNGATNGANTEKGAYDMSSSTLAGGKKTRISALARFWIPNQQEWYKAAAYDTSAGPRYWNYAVRADTITTSLVAVRPYTELVNVDQVINASGSALPAPPSYFGTYGQSGNAAEWVEAADPASPAAHGGSILSTSGWQYANVGDDAKTGDGVRTTSSFQPLNGAAGRYDIGFRIASIAPVKLPLPKAFSARYPGVAPEDRVDGLPAVVDYLVGGTLSSSPAQTNYPAHSIAGGKMQYSFTARTDDPSLDYEVQTATNLNGPWTTNNVTALPAVYISSELSRRTFEVPITGEKQRFFRLQVNP